MKILQLPKLLLAKFVITTSIKLIDEAQATLKQARTTSGLRKATRLIARAEKWKRWAFRLRGIKEPVPTPIKYRGSTPEKKIHNIAKAYLKRRGGGR